MRAWVGKAAAKGRVAAAMVVRMAAGVIVAARLEVRAVDMMAAGEERLVAAMMVVWVVEMRAADKRVLDMRVVRKVKVELTVEKGASKQSSQSRRSSRPRQGWQ